LGIFSSLTADELAALKANALAAITSGRRTSISGGAKSGSKEWQMSPMEILREVKYAEQKLGLIPQRVAKTYMDTVNPPCPAIVVNEQV